MSRYDSGVRARGSRESGDKTTVIQAVNRRLAAVAICALITACGRSESVVVYASVDSQLTEPVTGAVEESGDLDVSPARSNSRPPATVGSSGRELPLVPYRDLTPEQLAALLSTSDTTGMANRISAMAQDSDNELVCKTLHSLWTGESVPTIRYSQEVVSAPSVRLALAATLHQCRNGSDEYRDYVLSILKGSSDPMDRTRAAIALGIVGTDVGIDTLVNLASATDGVEVAIGAVGGLSSIGSEAARVALRQLAADGSLDPRVRDAAARMVR